MEIWQRQRRRAYAAGQLFRCAKSGPWRLAACKAPWKVVPGLFGRRLVRLPSIARCKFPVRVCDGFGENESGAHTCQVARQTLIIRIYFVLPARTWHLEQLKHRTPTQFPFVKPNQASYSLCLTAGDLAMAWAVRLIRPRSVRLYERRSDRLGIQRQRS